MDIEKRQRINKISVFITDYDMAIISLYRTNTKLGELTNRDIEVPDFSPSVIPNRQLYANYCRDVVANLLANGGIEGFYYEPKNVVEHVSRKYDGSSLQEYAKKAIISFIEPTVKLVDPDIQCKVIDFLIEYKIEDKYKDGYAKNAVVWIPVKIGNIDIKCPVYVKSGQMCKPKTFFYNNEEKSLNATTLKKVLKNELSSKS